MAAKKRKIVKKKRVTKTKVKKSCSKRKTKKVVTKKRVKGKAKKTDRRKSNPSSVYYVAFIVAKGTNFYYHGINFKTKGLKFSTDVKSPVVFTTRNNAIKQLQDMVKVFLPGQQKQIGKINAQKVGSKK